MKRLNTLVPSDPDLPPAAQVQKFITYYVNHRDLRLAACQARLVPELGEKLYKNPVVRGRIERKIMIQDVEEARIRARSNLLTNARLDSTVVDLLDKKQQGHVRLKAAELGYRRTGLIRDGEFYVAPDPNTTRNGPSIYQSKQITMRRTVTEEVTQTMPVDARPEFTVLEY